MDLSALRTLLPGRSPEMGVSLKLEDADDDFGTVTTDEGNGDDDDEGSMPHVSNVVDEQKSAIIDRIMRSLCDTFDTKVAALRRTTEVSSQTSLPRSAKKPAPLRS